MVTSVNHLHFIGIIIGLFKKDSLSTICAKMLELENITSEHFIVFERNIPLKGISRNFRKHFFAKTW